MDTKFSTSLANALREGVIGVTGGLPAHFLGLGTNALTSFINNRFAERSAQNQFNRAVSFWQMQNAYNSPSAQRKRLVDAGLNPAILAGDISGNNTAGSLSSVPGNQFAQSGILDSSTIGMQSQALQNAYTLKQIEALNEDIKSKKRENSIGDATYEDAVQRIKDEARSAHFTAEQQSLLDRFARETYLNSDGTTFRNPVLVDYNSKSYESAIKFSEQYFSSLRSTIQMVFGVDIDHLPDDLRLRTMQLYSLYCISDEKDRSHYESQLSQFLDDWVDNAFDKRDREVYKFIPYINELQESLPRLNELLSKFSFGDDRNIIVDWMRDKWNSFVN